MSNIDGDEYKDYINLSLLNHGLDSRVFHSPITSQRNHIQFLFKFSFLEENHQLLLP